MSSLNSIYQSRSRKKWDGGIEVFHLNSTCLNPELEAAKTGRPTNQQVHIASFPLDVDETVLYEKIDSIWRE